jgi:methionyl-tRNA formyltransferase
MEFWGIKGAVSLFLTILFRKLCSALPITPDYLRHRSTIKRTAKYFGIHYDLVDKVNDKEYLKHVRSLKPDVIVSFQHQIFREEILSIPRIACINCHPAALPKYRGVKPIFWGMLQGEEELGVTVHTMAPQIDAGRILSQKFYSLFPDGTLMDYYHTAYSMTCDAIVEALYKIESGVDFDEMPEIPISSKYYRNPCSEDLRRFKAAGMRII